MAQDAAPYRGLHRLLPASTALGSVFNAGWLNFGYFLFSMKMEFPCLLLIFFFFFLLLIFKEEKRDYFTRSSF